MSPDDLPDFRVEPLLMITRHYLLFMAILPLFWLPHICTGSELKETQYLLEDVLVNEIARVFLAI